MFRLFLKNRIAVGLTVAVLALTVVMTAAGVALTHATQTRFSDEGSVYSVSVAEDSTAVLNETRFASGSALSRSVSGTFSFTGAEGGTYSADEDAFVFYSDGSVTSVNGMILTDLSDFPDGLMDSYYLDSLLALQRDGTVYTIQNNTQEMTFENFLLKTGDLDYLIISPSLLLHRADGDDTVEGASSRFTIRTIRERS